MSFEGWYQILCETGHEHNCDCYDVYDFETWKCPICGKKIAYSNLVDTTNGSYDDYIDKKKEKILIKNNIDYFEDSQLKKHWTIWVEGDNDNEYWYGSDKEGNKIKLYKVKRIDGYVFFDIDKPLTTCTCKDCGNEHILTYPTYKIPEKGGHVVNAKTKV